MSKVGIFPLFAFIILTLIHGQSLAQSTLVTVLDKPVLVQLTLTKRDEDLTTMKTEIKYGNDHYSFDSDEHVDFVKSRCGWKDDYLFVPFNYGCMTGWNCLVDVIFKINNGKLVKLGELGTGDLLTKVGEEYEKGIFEVFYSKLEITDITSHMNAPRLKLALREKDGKFFVDLNETWLRNKKGFFKIESELQLEPKERSEQTDAGEWTLPWVFEAAVIAKYCDKNKDLDRIMKLAKRLLEEDEVFKVNELLKSVVPGEMNPPGDQKSD